MKKFIFILLFGSLLGTFFLDISHASGDNTDKNLAALSIKQAIENALAKNPMLEMVAAQANAAKNRTAQARSGFFPQVDLNGSWNRTTNPMWAFGTKLNQEKITQMDFAPDLLNNPDPINNFGADVSLRWALYNGGQIRTGRDQALLGEKIAVLGLTRARQQVIAQTATVYAGLLMAGENLNVIKQALKTAQTSLKMVQSRFNSGLAIKSDLLRAQVRIAKLAQLQTLAQSHVETAWANLTAIMGTLADDRYRLTSSLETAQKLEDALSTWITTALHHRPDLKQIRYQAQIAEKAVQKAHGAHLPSVGLFGKYEMNTEDFDNTADNYMFGAGVRINLFSGFRYTAGEKEARAMLAAAKAQEYQTILGIRVETESAFQQARSAFENIEVSRVAISQAEEALRIVRNRYRNGMMTIVGLLDAEVALQQARTNHFNRLHDYKVAMIRLMLAAGTIDQQVSDLL
jgi:outer membrane protein TolC